MDVFVLGSGGMMPMPERFLSSFLIRRDNDARSLLLDCGEGTQIQIKRLGLSWKAIDKILISHTHADHVTGLPGLLMLIGQADRIEPLHIYGPRRISDYIRSLQTLDPVIPYPVEVHEIGEEGVFFEDDTYSLECRWLVHTRPCLGYRLAERPRPGRFDAAQAEELGVPAGPTRAELVEGRSVRLEDGRTVQPEQVLGPPRRGLVVAYVTDTRPCQTAVELARDADLLICEGMYASEEEQDAKDKQHMSVREAAALATDAGAKRLLLTHVSPRYIGRSSAVLQQEAAAIFPQARLAADLQRISLDQPD